MKRFFAHVSAMPMPVKILTPVIMLLIAAGILTSASAQASISSEQAAIRQVSLQSLVTTQSLPAHRLSNKFVATQNGLTTTDITRISAAEASHMKVYAAQQYALLYYGALLSQKTVAMQQAIDHYAQSDVRYFGGGVSAIHYPKMTITGDIAQVAVEATIWAKKAQDQGHGILVYATPHNIVDYAFTLQKVQGTWYITTESWHFAPGSEP